MMASAGSWSGPCAAPIVRAAVATTSSSSARTLRSTNHTSRVRWRPASSAASRVLPVPPGPVNVSTRALSSIGNNRSMSSSRPMRLVAGLGKERLPQAVRRCGRSVRARRFHVGRRHPLQFRILRENRSLQGLQARTRIQSELGRERVTDPRKCLQRVPLPAGAIQRQHQVGVALLSEWVFIHDCARCRDRVGVTTERQQRRDPCLTGTQRGL